MRGIPTCEQVTALLTDFDEGGLGPLAWAGVRVHLGLCPPCRAFLHSLRRTPGVLRELFQEPAGTPDAADRALSGALGLIRQGRLPEGPSLHPHPGAWAALGAHGDPLEALLLRLHLGWCGACRAQRGADDALEAGGGPVPASLRALLPPESEWRWITRGLGGGRAARILKDPATGASLHLVQLAGGRTFPEHRHLGRETTLLLAGGLQDGPAHLCPGDWSEQAAGAIHAPAADPGEACWALVRLEGRVQFTGWRRILV